jgi:hypothetical protein
MTKAAPLQLPGQSKSEFTPPRWDENKNQYIQKIGYRMDAASKELKRKARPLGQDEMGAIAKSHKYQVEWKDIETRWNQFRPDLVAALPEYDWSKPCLVEAWMSAAIEAHKTLKRKIIADMESVKEHDTENVRLLKEFERNTEDTVAARLASQGKVAVSVSSALVRAALPHIPISIREAMELYGNHETTRLGKGGGQGLKTRPINNKLANLRYVFGIYVEINDDPEWKTIRVDVEQDIYKFGDEGCKQLADFWLALPNGMANRTAINYLNELKAFMEWCRLNLSDFYKPLILSGKAFKFKQPKTKKAIEYNAAMIKGVICSGAEKTRMFQLLALNCGMYQQDIADLQTTDLIIHNGVPCMWWLRSKETLAEGEDSTFRILTPLWPETYDLVKKYSAPPNKLGLMFLSEAGTALVSTRIGKRTLDYISKAHARAWKNYVKPMTNNRPRKKS